MSGLAIHVRQARDGRLAASSAPGRVGGWPLASLMGVTVLFATACANRQPIVPAATLLEIPGAWSGQDQGAGVPVPVSSLAQWWTRFDDPLLVALIDDALRSNTSIQAGIAALKQARALRDVQSAALLPALVGTASAQRSRVADAGSSNAFALGFDASWEPDVFGGQRAAVAAADSDVRSTAATLGNVQVSVIAEVAVDYMQLRGYQSRLGIAGDNLRSQEQTLQIVRWRAQAGLATELDIEQARSAAEQTRAQIPALQIAADQSEHALAVLTWHTPVALHERLSAPSVVVAPPDDLVLAFPAETLRQRPDVRAAEANVMAAFERLKQADAARYPSFPLSGSLGVNAVRIGALSSGASVVSALMASMTAPIFDGGAAKAQVRAQEAALRQTGAAYDAAILLALQDVEDSLAALRGDRNRLHSLRAAADAAQKASMLATQRYASGLIDFQAVLDTQRTTLITQDSVASSSTDLNVDHVRLYKALGGGWQNVEAPGSKRAQGTVDPAP